MHVRKQLAQVIDQILETEQEEIEPSTVEEYKKLGESCDQVLEKNKKRKMNIQK